MARQIQNSRGVRDMTPEEEAALDASAARNAARKAATGYKKCRIRKYKSERDQLGAIWKQIKADRDAGKVLHPETDAMLNDIEAVKAEEPKPV